MCVWGQTLASPGIRKKWRLSIPLLSVTNKMKHSKWANNREPQTFFELLMSLQGGTHVQYNRNPATMHNTTVSHTRPHKKGRKKKEDHNSSVSCDKTANTYTALNETLKQHEIMTIHCYNHLKEEGIRVNMHHAFQAKPKWHMQVMQTNHHPNTQYYKCVNPKTQFKGVKVIDQSFLWARKVLAASRSAAGLF